MRKNVELLQTLREALGENYDVMLDYWQSFDPIYAIALAERIAEYRPRWLEGAGMPDRIDSYVRVKESAPTFRSPTPSTNIRAGASGASSTRAHSTSSSPTSTGRAGFPRR
jgi:L-alanine-DL-glutamate epimerase-like enolase superfamily enzyme